MATESDSRVVEGFGQVSRTVGTIFRYLLLAATLFGIVILAVLLVYVANDAVQPLTADPGWHLTFFLTLVLPTTLVGGYLLRTNQSAAAFGGATVGLFAVSLMFGAGLAMILVDMVAPVVWFGYVLALVLGLGGVVAVERLDRRLPFTVRIVAALVAVALPIAAVETLGFAGPQSWVDWQFLTSAHSGTAERAGLYPAIGGSILLMTAVAVLSFPLGVGAAVYLEEYAPDNRITRFIDVNISNLAGVPSVVYGLLGLGVFVTYLGQPTGTVFVGGATLALLILPIVIISAREAIRGVPDELRQASYGMGATRWQTVKNVVLPRAFPGILTGTILALGRAIGETAPLIMIGAPNVVFNLPTELSSKVSAMPLQVYAWASLYASEPFYQQAVPAGVVVLLVVLLSMNSIAIVLRNKFQRDS